MAIARSDAPKAGQINPNTGLPYPPGYTPVNGSGLRLGESGPTVGTKENPHIVPSQTPTYAPSPNRPQETNINPGYRPPPSLQAMASTAPPDWNLLNYGNNAPNPASVNNPDYRIGGTAEPQDLVTPGAGGTIDAGPIRRDTYEDALMLDKRAKLSDETFAKRLALLSGYMSSGEAGPAPDHSDTPQAQAARAAAFARAKDINAQTARASLDSLRGIMSERGMLGSGLEAGEIGKTVERAEGGIGEFNRDQLMSDLDRISALEDRNYAGNLTRRGQDLSLKGSLLGLVNATSLY
jgi:hypothetical protein